jgi:hypothetical protein
VHLFFLWVESVDLALSSVQERVLRGGHDVPEATVRRLGILLICVIGATGVGMFATDPMPLRFPLSTRGTLHVIFGTSQLVLLPFAALLINFSLARHNEAWRSARRVLLWTAGLPLFGFSSFAVYSAIFVFPLGLGAYGPGVNIGWPPRFAFFTYMLWVVILGW